jgi:hypothetical protein
MVCNRCKIFLDFDAMSEMVYTLYLSVKLNYITILLNIKLFKVKDAKGLFRIFDYLKYLREKD